LLVPRIKTAALLCNHWIARGARPRVITVISSLFRSFLYIARRNRSASAFLFPRTGSLPYSLAVAVHFSIFRQLQLRYSEWVSLTRNLGQPWWQRPLLAIVLASPSAVLTFIASSAKAAAEASYRGQLAAATCGHRGRLYARIRVLNSRRTVVPVGDFPSKMQLVRGKQDSNADAPAKSARDKNQKNLIFLLKSTRALLTIP
jgi:hypothetical protein